MVNLIAACRLLAKFVMSIKHRQINGDILINIRRQLKLARPQKKKKEKKKKIFFTLQQVAKRTGVSAGLISKIEIKNTPSLPVLPAVRK